MPGTRFLRRVEQAVRDQQLVRVTRRKGWDRLDGTITGCSPKWLLLALELDAGFNGHALVRVSDVDHVGLQPHAAFLERALALEGHWPLPQHPAIDLSSTRNALTTLAETGFLVSVHDEYTDPHACLIGTPRNFRRKKFGLHTVTPAAQWDSEDSTLRYRAVSRLDVGGAYERRLAAVAGAPPRHLRPHG